MSIMDIIRFIVLIVKTFFLAASSTVLFLAVLGRTIWKMWNA